MLLHPSDQGQHISPKTCGNNEDDVMAIASYLSDQTCDPCLIIREYQKNSSLYPTKSQNCVLYNYQGPGQEKPKMVLYPRGTKDITHAMWQAGWDSRRENR